MTIGARLTVWFFLGLGAVGLGVWSVYLLLEEPDTTKDIHGSLDKSASPRPSSLEANQRPSVPTSLRSAIRPRAESSRTERDEQPEQLSIEESHARDQRRVEEFIGRHEAEPVETEWEKRKTEEIGSTLARLGTDLGFEVANLSCRSQTCVARVRWQSFEQAQAEYQAIAFKSSICETMISLPPPESDAEGTEYEQVVLYKCERGREQTAG